MNRLEPHAWVFAYGSNMNLSDLRRWLREREHPVSGVLGSFAATLPGFRLMWNYKSLHRDGGAANVQADVRAALPGVTLAVDQPTLHAIDTKEGHPRRYRRDETREVQLATGGTVMAWVYQVSEPYLKPAPVWPRRAYLDLMIRGAREHGLPPDYITELEATPTCD